MCLTFLPTEPDSRTNSWLRFSDQKRLRTFSLTASAAIMCPSVRADTINNVSVSWRCQLLDSWPFCSEQGECFVAMHANISTPNPCPLRALPYMRLRIPRDHSVCLETTGLSFSNGLKLKSHRKARECLGRKIESGIGEKVTEDRRVLEGVQLILWAC